MFKLMDKKKIATYLLEKTKTPSPHDTSARHNIHTQGAEVTGQLRVNGKYRVYWTVGHLRY